LPASTAYPSDEEFIAAYCRRRGIDGIDNFRMGAILQGVLKRALEGNASNPESAKKLGGYLPIFAENGLRVLDKG